MVRTSLSLVLSLVVVLGAVVCHADLPVMPASFSWTATIYLSIAPNTPATEVHQSFLSTANANYTRSDTHVLTVPNAPNSTLITVNNGANITTYTIIPSVNFCHSTVTPVPTSTPAPNNCGAPQPIESISYDHETCDGWEIQCPTVTTKTYFDGNTPCLTNTTIGGAAWSAIEYTDYSPKAPDQSLFTPPSFCSQTAAAGVHLLEALRKYVPLRSLHKPLDGVLEY